MIDSAAAAAPPAPLPSGNKEQEDQEEDDDLRQDLESVLSQGASPPAAAPEEAPAQAPDAAEAEPAQAEDKKTQQEAIQKLQDLFPSQGSAPGVSDSAIKGVQEQLKAFIDGKLQGGARRPDDCEIKQKTDCDKDERCSWHNKYKKCISIYDEDSEDEDEYTDSAIKGVQEQLKAFIDGKLQGGARRPDDCEIKQKTDCDKDERCSWHNTSKKCISIYDEDSEDEDED